MPNYIRLSHGEVAQSKIVDTARRHRPSLRQQSNLYHSFGRVFSGNVASEIHVGQ